MRTVKYKRFWNSIRDKFQMLFLVAEGSITMDGYEDVCNAELKVDLTGFSTIRTNSISTNHVSSMYNSVSVQDATVLVLTAGRALDVDRFTFDLRIDHLDRLSLFVSVYDIYKHTSVRAFKRGEHLTVVIHD